MRKIVVGAFVSLDGIMQGPGGPVEDRSGGFELGGWTVPFFDDLSGAAVGELLSPPYDLLLGRKTYDIFAGYWPKAAESGDPLGQQFNAVTKYVASRNQDLNLAWQNSRQLGADPVAELRQIKQEDGPRLVTQGSTDFLKTLFQGDLVDEMTLLIFPVLLGHGKRLFGEGQMASTFKLMDTKASPSGVVINRYERAGEVVTGSF